MAFNLSGPIVVGLLVDGRDGRLPAVLWTVSNRVDNPACGLYRALEALGAGRIFIARGMEAVMLAIPLQGVAVAPLAFPDTQRSVLQLVAAIHARCINARRIDNRKIKGP